MNSVTHHSFITTLYQHKYTQISSTGRLFDETMMMINKTSPSSSTKRGIILSFVYKLAVFSILRHYFSTLFSKLFSNQCSPPPPSLFSPIQTSDPLSGSSHGLLSSNVDDDELCFIDLSKATETPHGVPGRTN